MSRVLKRCIFFSSIFALTGHAAFHFEISSNIEVNGWKNFHSGEIKGPFNEADTLLKYMNYELKPDGNVLFGFRAAPMVSLKKTLTASIDFGIQSNFEDVMEIQAVPTMSSTYIDDRISGRIGAGYSAVFFSPNRCPERVCSAGENNEFQNTFLIAVDPIRIRLHRVVITPARIGLPFQSTKLWSLGSVFSYEI